MIIITKKTNLTIGMFLIEYQTADHQELLTAVSDKVLEKF